MAAAVEKIVMAAQAACGDDDALRLLGAAATQVTQALNSLIEQIKQGVQMDTVTEYDEACAAILAATDKLFRYVYLLCVLYVLYILRKNILLLV